MDIDLYPMMLKVRLPPKATAKVLSWHIPNPKPLLTLTTVQPNDFTTAQVVITSARLADNTEGMPDEMKELIEGESPTVTSREAILFRNILASDSEPTNYVSIDLPDTTSNKYTLDELKHIALKTFTAFLGCKKMGWVKVTTSRYGVDQVAVDYIQIMSAWLAGLEEIQFVTNETSKAFDLFTSQGMTMASSYMSESRDILGGKYEIYPIEKEVNWIESPLEVGDLIRFNEAQHYHRDIFVYGIVTKVSKAGTVTFKKLKTNETMVHDNWVELHSLAKYVSPIIPTNIKTAVLDTGMLRPVKDGSYNYNKHPVSVYTVLPSDIVYQQDRSD